MPDGQSLPSAHPIALRQSIQGHAPTKWDLHPNQQSPPWTSGAPLSRPFQGDPGRWRRVFTGACALRGAEPGTRAHGQAPGRLALEQLLRQHGKVKAEPFLAVDGLLAQFASRRAVAQARYAKFVTEGIKADSPWAELKGQVFLGSDEFVETMQARAEMNNQQDVQIPKAQRRPPPPSLKAIDKAEKNRNAAIVRAHATGAYPYQQIADHFGVHFTTVGRVVRMGR